MVFEQFRFLYSSSGNSPMVSYTESQEFAGIHKNSQEFTGIQESLKGVRKLKDISEIHAAF